MRCSLNIITLGCSKNLVDSEHLAGRAEQAGWDVVFDAEAAPGQVVVVNTCGFIGDAKAESIDAVLELAERRKAGEIDRLYVIGCLSERYHKELRKEIPEVDGFAGFFKNLRPARKISTPSHYAYLKISEGCDRRCGFCAIPLIRGRHVSVPMRELVREARGLAAEGVKELIVIAQDVTLWGLDIYGERRLAELLRELAQVDGIEWIRLHYGYPAGFPEDVIALMASEPKICKYLDIPLQHISDSQLRAMKRGLDGAGTRALIEKLRAEIPGLALRTTMLVGYPGETEADFEELLAFVKEARFERLGAFAYSAEEGTHAGDHLKDDVPDEVKQARLERLMEAQREVSAELNEARVGGVERVIADRREGGFWVCRSEWDSPEVDTEILVANELRQGEFFDVEITSADEYDLFGKIYIPL